MTERLTLLNDQPAGGQLTALPEPAAELARKMAPTLAQAVDELHVAAVLESMGVTDSVAQDTYDHDDVFALADVVYRRRPAADDQARWDAPSAPEGPGGTRRTLRVLCHGPLYMMASMVYPAVFAALGLAAVFRVLVFMTALGWVWGMGTGAVAYQLLGQGMERSAGRALRLLSLAGLAVALVSGILFAVAGSGGPGVVAFAVAQMSFQLMSGVVLFYGKELRLALTMLPACVAGGIFVVSGSAPALVAPTLAAGGLSIVLLVVTAWVTSTRAPVRPDARGAVAFARAFVGAGPSVCYAMLCAAYFLGISARFLIGEIDLAIAALPLILGMGVLEWRAYRFTDKAGKLLGRAATSAEFRHAAWRLLLAELANCLTALGALGAVFLILLNEFGLLSTRGALLVDAYVLLGGVFFLGFVMARHQQFAWLLGIMSPVVAAEVLMTGWFAPHGVVLIFLLSTAILLMLQLVMLRVSFRRIHRYQ